MRTFATALVVITIVCLANTSASAVLMNIDFEAEGAMMGEGAQITTIDIATFSVFGAASGNPRLAAPGGANRGFQNLIEGSDVPDTTSPLFDPNSRFFITNGSQDPKDNSNYAIDFSTDVTMFSLQLYDYRADGNPEDGMPGVDSVDLIGYLDGGVVETVSWTVPDPRPIDGNIVELALSGATQVDRVEVVFNGHDLGTGIDNVTYEAVPEPSAAVFALLGIFSLSMLRRR